MHFDHMIIGSDSIRLHIILFLRIRRASENIISWKINFFESIRERRYIFYNVTYTVITTVYLMLFICYSGHDCQRNNNNHFHSSSVQTRGSYGFVRIRFIRAIRCARLVLHRTRRVYFKSDVYALKPMINLPENFIFTCCLHIWIALEPTHILYTMFTVYVPLWRSL